MSCKLYLVPEDIINTWKSEQRTQQTNNPLETAISQIDKNMQSVLKDKHLSDYDKEKIYTQKQATFVDMRDELTTPVRTENTINESNDILDSVPKLYHKKANALLKYLQMDKDVNWDNQGQLIINGKTIPQSHIVDLVNDGMRLRKKKQHAKGWRELSHHLAMKNVPKELIGNDDWINTSNTIRKESASPKIKSTVTKPLKRLGPRSSKVKAKEQIKEWTSTIKKPIKGNNPRKSKLKAKEKIKEWISIQDNYDF